MKISVADVPLEIEGRATLYLRFSFVAMDAMQKHWELPDLDAVDAKLALIQTGKLSVDDLLTIFWATLQSRHSDMKREEIMAILDEVGPKNFQQMLTEAAKAAQAAGGGGSAPANPPKRPARKSRGR